MSAVLEPTIPSITTIRKMDRYAGLRPFIKDDRLIFFGRNKEIDIVYNGIQVNPAFVLYGKSGLGKSSLVFAGLLPKIEKQRCLTAVIRFYNENEKKSKTKKVSATAIIISELSNCFPGRTKIPKEENAFLKWLARQKKTATFLIVFDQFEEFLYYSEEERFSAYKFINKLLQPGPVIVLKALFLIRSDRFFLMKEVSNVLVGILNCTYELRPLTIDKAEEAIELPGQIPSQESADAEFKTAPFEYSPPALKLLLDTLKNSLDEIESSQLQIVCQEMELIAARTSTITPEDFGGENGIRDILNTFYDKQIEKLAKDTELRLSRKDMLVIRELLEDELVSEGKRVVQSDRKVRHMFSTINLGHLSLEPSQKIDLIIDRLLGLRLIREDDSHLGKVYEISHDTLLPAILEAKEQTKSKEKFFTLMKRVAFGALVVFIFIGVLFFIAKQRHEKDIAFLKVRAKIEADNKYRNSIEKSRIKLLHNDSLLLGKNRLNKRLDDILLQKMNAIEHAKDSATKINKLLGAAQDSLKSQIQLYQNNLRNQNLIVLQVRQELTTKSIMVDTLEKRIAELKDNNSTAKILINPSLTNQLKSENQQLITAAKMVYKESWFKPGYFLSFENIKVLLVNLDKRGKKIQYQLYDVKVPGVNETLIANKNMYLLVGQSNNFDYNGSHYTIEFTRISAAGSIFSSGAYIIFSKNP